MKTFLTTRNLFVVAGVFALAGLSSCNKQDGYALADTNADDNVDQAEFSRFMMEAIYSEMDADGNSRVTLEESRLAYPQTKEEKFAKADADGDGVITPDEAKVHFEKQGTFTDLFTKIDKDQSDGISREEARAFMDKMEAQAGTKLEQLEQAADES